MTMTAQDIRTEEEIEAAFNYGVMQAAADRAIEIYGLGYEDVIYFAYQFAHTAETTNSAAVRAAYLTGYASDNR